MLCWAVDVNSQAARSDNSISSSHAGRLQLGVFVRGLLQAQMKIRSLFSHPRVVPDLFFRQLMAEGDV